MRYKIREILEGEHDLLEHFLYEAIFVPEGMAAPPRSILDQPESQVYLRNFGKKPDDLGLVAEVDAKVVGAVWARVMNDYGHVNDSTPSLAISLYREYRGAGIGTALMKEMLHKLKQKGYAQTSLAVQKANYAVNLYRKLEFEIIEENEEEYKMIRELR